MTGLSSILLMPFLCNCILASSLSMLSPLKTEGGLRMFKEEPNEFEYVIKRHHSSDSRSEDPDSKERRSSAGSSFIRFGRSEIEGNMENTNFGSDLDGSLKVNRYPRWKSPDIVIRFGRSSSKTTEAERGYKRGRNDLNFIRFGRNIQVYPFELDLSTICPEILSNSVKLNRDPQPIVVRLMRLCNVLNNIEDDHRNNFDFFDHQANTERK